jgi:hypothetical protein
MGRLRWKSGDDQFLVMHPTLATTKQNRHAKTKNRIVVPHNLTPGETGGRLIPAPMHRGSKHVKIANKRPDRSSKTSRLPLYRPNGWEFITRILPALMLAASNVRLKNQKIMSF